MSGENNTYKSKYFTAEEIDQRLLQGYYDDAVQAGYKGTKDKFLNSLVESLDSAEILQREIDNTNAVTGIEFVKYLTTALGVITSEGTIGSTSYMVYTESFDGGVTVLINNNNVYTISEAFRVKEGIKEIISVNSSRLQTERGYTYQLNISKTNTGAFTSDELEGIASIYNYETINFIIDKIIQAKIAKSSLDYKNSGFISQNSKLTFHKQNLLGEVITDDIPAATVQAAGVMSAEDKNALDNLQLIGNIPVVRSYSLNAKEKHFFGKFKLKKNYNYTFDFVEEIISDSPLYTGLKKASDNSSLVAENTKNSFSYIAKEDVEASIYLYSSDDNVVTVTITYLPVLQKEITDSLGYEGMPVVPVVAPSYWSRYSDGVLVNTHSLFTQYRYNVSNYEGRVIKISSYSPDTNGAIVAFYSSADISANTYMKDVSVQAKGGYEVLDVIIPNGAVMMIITHRAIDDFTKPIILMNGLVESPQSLAQVEERVSVIEGFIKIPIRENILTGGYVRYSDGLFVSTGAHWYYCRVDVLGLKDIAITGKWYDAVATPIAFYNADGTYLKEDSVVGAKGDNLTFTATVPSDAYYAICCSAESIDIYTNSTGALLGVFPKKYVDPLKAFINPFEGKPLYHHLNQERVSAIPAQSLYDIAYAKALGFSVIEANVHRCADGIYVTKHGSGGKLGAALIFAEGSGLSADTNFSDVTSEELRANVVYDTPAPQYSGRIPTLDEFCAECKRLRMKILLQVIDDEVLRIARTYFADNDIIAYGIKSRGDFKGLITTFQNVSDTTTVDSVLGICEKFGKPYMFGGFWDSAISDEKVKEITNALHSNGYLTAGAYAETAAIRRLSGLGVDVFASMADVNLFNFGNRNNIFSVGELAIVSGDVSIDGNTAYMSQGSRLQLSDEVYKNHYGMMVQVSVLFDGDLSFFLGGTKSYSIASNGDSWVTLARANNGIMHLTANTDTIIKGVKILSSIVI